MSKYFGMEILLSCKYDRLESTAFLWKVLGCIQSVSKIPNRTIVSKTEHKYLASDTGVYNQTLSPKAGRKCLKSDASRRISKNAIEGSCLGNEDEK